MGKVLWHVTMSLDGFISGPEDAMDWVFRYAGPNRDTGDVAQTTGAVLAGRRSYDVGRAPGRRPEAPKVFGGAWSGPMFVLTHEAPPAEEDETISFVSGDIRRAVRTALSAAGGKNLLVIGANVAKQCVDAGLIDEILVHSVPLVLGEGVRFFDRSGLPIEIEPISVNQVGMVVNLRARVVKASNAVLASGNVRVAELPPG